MYPNSTPDIKILAEEVLQIFCWQGCFTIQKCQSRKREIIQPNVYGMLPKLNQVIYTLDTICMPKNMIIAQAVLQVFCWQGPVWVKFLSMERKIVQSNIHWILWKVNQVICIMYSSYMPGIMSLAQAVLQIFCWQGCFTIQNAKSEKGNNQIFTEFYEKLIRSSTSCI